MIRLGEIQKTQQGYLHKSFSRKTENERKLFKSLNVF
jgi:hypothetical protein